MPTVLQLNEHIKDGKDHSSQIGWGKYRTKTVKWVFENDPEYLIWCYYNLRNAHLKKDICDKLGLDSGIEFTQRKKLLLKPE